MQGRRTEPFAPGEAAASRREPVLLDEPTNNLNINTPTRRSKKRCSWFPAAPSSSATTVGLDRIATHIIGVEGDSKVVWFQGNYQDYEVDRKRQLGAEANQPHRGSTRKLADNGRCHHRHVVVASCRRASRQRRSALLTCCGAAGCARSEPTALPLYRYRWNRLGILPVRRRAREGLERAPAGDQGNG